MAGAKEPRRGDRLLGPLEAEVMEAVWAADGAVTVRDVVDRVNARREQALAYTTVMTVMSRLADKGALSRRREGRGYVYEAAASDPAAMAVRRVMRQFGDAAMAHFVSEAKDDPEVLKRLQRLLEEEQN